MSDNTKNEEILEARMRNIEMDLKMVENNQERLENNRAQLVLKLIETRETLLSLQEQDE
jgi:predicted  nucleic acid-binding Zn-ribbon protein